ncbi:hypothetical protein BKA65DRAFT_490136 [Rhexocercosporidium sp. MPI-PUGE-AT-0058]|nr:hypothetical protein BKA65DRAFT_490136 [Rhexocercosporidium sp. MPI-PUGE-AT-0058]
MQQAKEMDNRQAFNPFGLRHPQTEKEISKEKLEEDGIPKKPPIASRYINMLLHIDEIPWWHSTLASLFTWLLLAGYVILPGAFTSIRNSRVLSEEAGAAGKAVVKAAQTWPVLTVASVCCVGGASGMCWLWVKWRNNYIWLLRKIIEPGMLNSLAGLITTIVNVYTARDKYWSRTAIITATVMGTCASILMISFFIHNFWNLKHVREEHLRLEKQAEDANKTM